MRLGWRPAIGTIVRDHLGAMLYEVIAHFTDERYGECVVLKRAAPGGWSTQILTRSQWDSSYFVLRSQPIGRKA